jgi:putative ABC transport system substrate-binding protein
MRRREFVAWAVCAVAMAPAVSPAQQPKVPVVGVLVIGKPDPTPMPHQFRAEPRRLGYVEGRNIRFEIRSAEGRLDRLPELAAGLVRDKADVIAASMTPTVLAAEGATSEIPIVMIGVADPVRVGIVASLAHPGGNITGMAALITELAVKQLELLKEAIPGVHRIAVLCNAPDPFSKPFVAHVEAAGHSQKVEIVPFIVSAGLELDPAFSAMAEKKVEAVIVRPSLPLADVADLAFRYRLAAVSPMPRFPRVGGLMAYANDPTEFYQRAAGFVDKILKGAKPAELPVEQPMRLRLNINLKTARALGLTIPPTLLARADEVIE